METVGALFERWEFLFNAMLLPYTKQAGIDMADEMADLESRISAIPSSEKSDVQNKLSIVFRGGDVDPISSGGILIASVLKDLEHPRMIKRLRLEAAALV